MRDFWLNFACAIVEINIMVDASSLLQQEIRIGICVNTRGFSFGHVLEEALPSGRIVAWEF
jgi:hypothetical protein